MVDSYQKYLTLSQAAKYCGYSGNHFKTLIVEYKIPLYGPKKNRFKTDDLDNFMNNPSYYLVTTSTTRRKWKEVRV